MTKQDDALLLASPAPAEEEPEEDGIQEHEEEGQRPLGELCEAWAGWVRSRRLYVKPSAPVSLLGKLTQRGTGRSANGGPDAISSAELMAFHLAVLAQPIEALDRKVFELHYYWRVRNIKRAAAEMGIGRAHWYRLVHDFRTRVFAASREILNVNMAAADALPSRKEKL